MQEDGIFHHTPSLDSIGVGRVVQVTRRPHITPSVDEHRLRRAYWGVVRSCRSSRCFSAISAASSPQVRVPRARLLNSVIVLPAG